MTRLASVALVLAVGVLGCGDDDNSGRDAGGYDGGDQDAGGAAQCPNLAGTWTIDAHCGGAPLIGMSVPVTQSGCTFVSGGTFAGFTGTVGEDGTFEMSGEAGGMTIECSGTATASLIDQTCTGDCEVTLSK